MAIRNFRHKGLSALYSKGTSRGIEAQYVEKARRIIAKLETATVPADMNLPGYRMHPLRGEYAGYWSVTLGANWRIIYRFEGHDVCDVDLVDYH